MTSSALSDIMRWGKIIGTNMFSFFLNPFGLNILVFFSAFNCLDYLNVPKKSFILQVVTKWFHVNYMNYWWNAWDKKLFQANGYYGYKWVFCTVTRWRTVCSIRLHVFVFLQKNLCFPNFSDATWRLDWCNRNSFDILQLTTFYVPTI